VVAGSLAIAAIVYAPFALSNLPAHMSTEVTWSVVGLAVVPTFAGFIVFFALIGEIGPVRTTVVTYVNPAVALILGVALLGEPFTARPRRRLPAGHRRLGARDPPAPGCRRQLASRGRRFGARPYDVTRTGQQWTVIPSC